MSDPPNSAVHVIVRGRVQGVGYRAFVAENAVARGLRGWVRNRRDGSVEAIFAGAAEEVAAMIDKCRAGPRLARVEELRADDAEDEGWSDFAVRATV